MKAAPRAGSDKRVLVGLSGGIDSAVTAGLLLNQGFEVRGVYLQLFDADMPGAAWLKAHGRCCVQDAQGARRARAVAEQLGIEFEVVDVQDIFFDQVVDDFVHEYLLRRVPVPCARTQVLVKIASLIKRAEQLGCGQVATGHYAQVTADSSEGPYRLVRAADEAWDQTYLLATLTQKELSRLVMPVGSLPRAMVSRLAKQFGFEVDAAANPRPKLCFVGEPGYIEFIDSRSHSSLRVKGMVRTLDGQMITEHTGLHSYTIGHRIEIPVRGKEADVVWVIGFDLSNQSAVVGEEKFLFSKEVIVTDVVWVNPVDELRALDCQAMLASDRPAVRCQVTCFANRVAHVEFEDKQRLFLPGQQVVFYDGTEVLGRGTIDKTVSDHLNQAVI